MPQQKTTRRGKKDTGVEHLAYGSAAPMAGLDLGKGRKRASSSPKPSARRKTATPRPIVYK